MTRSKFWVIGALTLLGTASLPAEAQVRVPHGGCGQGGWGPNGPYFGSFDSTKVETLSGEVIRIERVHPLKGVSEGVHIVLKTAREQIGVHLGPAWYIDNQGTSLEAKDKIEVTGSRIQLDGKTVIIASELRRGDTVLKLRDAEGHPVWCGWRRR